MLAPALPTPSPPLVGASGEIGREEMDVAPPALFQTHDLDSDLVSLKISLLGDCQIGKTSFLVGVHHFFVAYIVIEPTWIFFYILVLLGLT